MNRDDFPFPPAEYQLLILLLRWSNDRRSFKQQVKASIEPEY